MLAPSSIWGWTMGLLPRRMQQHLLPYSLKRAMRMRWCLEMAFRMTPTTRDRRRRMPSYPARRVYPPAVSCVSRLILIH